MIHKISSATWSNRNEAHNPKQSVDELIIKDQKMIEVEMEIRRQVDNLMREELDLLKAVSTKFCKLSSQDFVNNRQSRETRVRRERLARSERRGRKEVRKEKRRRTRI